MYYRFTAIAFIYIGEYWHLGNGFLKHFGQSRRTIAMDRDNYLRDAKYPSFLLYVLFGLGMAGTIHQVIHEYDLLQSVVKFILCKMLRYF